MGFHSLLSYLTVLAEDLVHIEKIHFHEKIIFIKNELGSVKKRFHCLVMKIKLFSGGTFISSFMDWLNCSSFKAKQLGEKLLELIPIENVIQIIVIIVENYSLYFLCCFDSFLLRF